MRLLTSILELEKKEAGFAGLPSPKNTPLWLQFYLRDAVLG